MARSQPSIAQLAERETVEAQQLSLGHWFESGSTESFFFEHFQIDENILRQSMNVNSKCLKNYTVHVTWTMDRYQKPFFENITK